MMYWYKLVTETISEISLFKMFGANFPKKCFRLKTRMIVSLAGAVAF